MCSVDLGRLRNEGALIEEVEEEEAKVEQTVEVAGREEWREAIEEAAAWRDKLFVCSCILSYSPTLVSNHTNTIELIFLFLFLTEVSSN